MSFLDFHVIVNKVPGDDGFVTVVAEAPVPRWGYTFSRFGGGERVENALGPIEGIELTRAGQGAFLLRSNGTFLPLEGRDVRPIAESPFADPGEIGRALFRLLFPEGTAAYEILGRSAHKANSNNKDLRLKLELHSDLTILPWETLRAPLTGSWATVLNQVRMSIVRYLGDLFEPDEVVRPRGKPCILVVTSHPQDLKGPYLGEIKNSFEAERQNVEAFLRKHEAQVECEVIASSKTFFKLTQKVRQLQAEGRPIVGLHFIGHGGIDEAGGYLLGEDENACSHKIYESRLGDALDRVTTLRWVILNACSTAVEPVGCPLAGLATWMSVIKNVPTVIAYRRPIDTNDAEKLAGEFYKAAIEGETAIEEVVRNLQNLYQNPGGLVVLARSVNGRIQSHLGFAGSASQPGPGATASNQSGPGSHSTTAPRARKPRAPRAPEPALLPKEVGEMVHIPAGPFKKGLTPQQIDFLIDQFHHSDLPIDLESAREVLTREAEEVVELPDFYIDLTPVTNAQFREFVEASGYITEAEEARAPQNWRLHDRPDRADHPVVFVSYNDAQEYCGWAGKRLPTADEWKKACRGPKGRIYPWGDEYDPALCNTAESQQGWETTPVTRFPQGRSFYGLYDMVGNVEEWTSTAGKRGSRTVLGGSWCMTCQVYGLPVLERYAAPTFYSNEQGFRCAKDV